MLAVMERITEPNSRGGPCLGSSEEGALSIRVVVIPSTRSIFSSDSHASLPELSSSIPGSMTEKIDSVMQKIWGQVEMGCYTRKRKPHKCVCECIHGYIIHNFFVASQNINAEFPCPLFAPFFGQSCS